MLHGIVARVLVHRLIGFVGHHFYPEIFVAQQGVYASARTSIVLYDFNRFFNHFFTGRWIQMHHKIIVLTNHRRCWVHNLCRWGNISCFDRYLCECCTLRRREFFRIVFQLHIHHIQLLFDGKIFMDTGLEIQSFAIGAIIHFDTGERVRIEKEHRIGHGIGR